MKSFYKELMLLNELKTEIKNKENKEKIEKRIIEIKRKMRKINKKEKTEKYILFGETDYIIKYRFDFPLTNEIKKQIYNELYIPRPYSYYDCTGKEFTWNINFYTINNNKAFFVYHTIAIDV